MPIDSVGQEVDFVEDSMLTLKKWFEWLEEGGLEPRGILEHKPNDRCYCESGRKFKKCCG